MAITKTTEDDKIEIVKDIKAIQVRTATIVTDYGKEISRTFSRHILNPNSDLTN